eukprot:Awhi_evm1s4309
MGHIPAHFDERKAIGLAIYTWTLNRVIFFVVSNVFDFYPTTFVIIHIAFIILTVPTMLFVIFFPKLKNWNLSKESIRTSNSEQLNETYVTPLSPQLQLARYRKKTQDLERENNLLRKRNEKLTELLQQHNIAIMDLNTNSKYPGILSNNRFSHTISVDNLRSIDNFSKATNNGADNIVIENGLCVLNNINSNDEGASLKQFSSVDRLSSITPINTISSIDNLCDDKTNNKNDKNNVNNNNNNNNSSSNNY